MDQVLPHSPLQKLSNDLWIIEGTLPHKNPLPRNMLIFRTQDEELWIHSPIAVNDKTIEEIKALGIPKWIVVPNDMHRLDANTWKETFPEARVVCPRAARSKVEKKVKVDDACEDVFKEVPVLAHSMTGAKRLELAYELKLKEGKALVVNDLIVNVDHLPGFFGKIFKLMGRIGRFRVPKPQQFIYLYQKKLFKEWLQKMSEREFSIITLSHGKPIMNNISQWLNSAAENL